MKSVNKVGSVVLVVAFVIGFLGAIISLLIFAVFKDVQSDIHWYLSRAYEITETIFWLGFITGVAAKLFSYMLYFDMLIEEENDDPELEIETDETI